MHKFPSHHNRLEVMEWSKFAPEGHLNQQLAILLSDLGIHNDVMERQCLRSLDDLKQLTSGDPKNVLRVLRGSEQPLISIGSLLRCALLSGAPCSEYFISLALERLQELGLKNFESHRNRIQMPETRFFIGVPDAEVRILQEGEVFVRPSYMQNGECRPGKPLVGPVAVTRFPALHPGDVRLLQAVDHPSLHHMNDCVVFPTRGSRDHPSEMSGGDVDGDHFLVIWNRELLPPLCHDPGVGSDALAPSEMANYGAIIGEDPSKPVTIDEIKDFFIQYVENDQLGAISTAFVFHWDVESQDSGSLSPKCLRLAELSSFAVDAAKTGKIPKLPPDLNIAFRGEYVNKNNILSRLQFLAMRLSDQIRSERVKIPELQPYPRLVREENSKYLVEAIALCEQFVEDLVVIFTQYRTNDSNFDVFDLLTLGRSKRKEGFRIAQARAAECISLFQRYLNVFEQEFYEKFGTRMHEDPLAQSDMSIKASAWYEAGYFIAQKLRAEQKSYFVNALQFAWLAHEHLERMLVEQTNEDPNDAERISRSGLHVHPRFIRHVRIV
eukprot:c12837_g1_i1.p1 GENE.c12837_g1_i1~~c12837_g1_i1.p1  ORF type:complete len:576 (+),score=139.54 c12837_g1_i1:75-1730(+)